MMKFVSVLSLAASTAAFTSGPARHAPVTRLSESKVRVYRFFFSSYSAGHWLLSWFVFLFPQHCPWKFRLFHCRQICKRWPVSWTLLLSSGILLVWSMRDIGGLTKLEPLVGCVSPKLSTDVSQWLPLLDIVCNLILSSHGLWLPAESPTHLLLSPRRTNGTPFLLPPKLKSFCSLDFWNGTLNWM